MSLEADLMRVEAYEGLETSKVGLVETHISWVFVLDRDRLNSRLAPTIYHGIVAS